jgi:hypothetical protein
MKKKHEAYQEVRSSINYLQLTLCIKREPIDGGSQSTFYANMVGNFAITQKTQTLTNNKIYLQFQKRKKSGILNQGIVVNALTSNKTSKGSPSND